MKKLNKQTCIEIYQCIFETLTTVLMNSESKLSNESVNYLAQQYYDAILINNNQELDPNIFTQRASLNNINTQEVALLSFMFEGTDFNFPIVEELKRRS